MLFEFFSGNEKAPQSARFLTKRLPVAKKLRRLLR
jgi:hypothetical protein